MDIKVNNNTVIVFDLDDTLYNEIEFLKSAYMTIARKVDIINFLSLYAHMFALYRNNQDTFEFISLNYNISKTSLIQIYRSHKPYINLFPGVLDTLKLIKIKNGKIGLITDGRIETQTNKIIALGIESFFDHIIISEEIGTEKPHENNFKLISDKYVGNSFLYIADNIKKDFITPNTLGWQTIGIIDNGLNIHNNTDLFKKKEFQPNKYVLSVSDINII